MSGAKVLSLSTGSKAWIGDQEVTIAAVIGIDKVLVTRADGSADTVAIASLRAAPTAQQVVIVRAPDLATVSEVEWQQAVQRAGVIRRISELPRSSKAQVKEASASIGIGVALMYRLIGRWRAGGEVVSSLLPRKSGPRPGTVTHLSPEMLAIIEGAINDVWMTRQKPKKEAVIVEVNLRCRRAGKAPPSPTTVRKRIDARDAMAATKAREGSKAAHDRYAPAIGHFPETSWPLQVIQIDHTPVDAIILDQKYRLPIGRPWLTLAIDVHTRMVAGFLLSWEDPCATSVALCITHTVSPKDDWLARRKIDTSWPIWGTPDTIHLDNAKEFRGEALTRGCEQHGIILDYRPVRTPRYGGHIERLIGTMMGQVHLLPGTTFSNIDERGAYNSETAARLTLPELDEWLTLGIDIYHHKIHSSLGIPPLVAWERGILGTDDAPGRGLPARITDTKRFLIDFLPLERRSVGREGVRISHIHYWSDVLRPLINNGIRYIVRYDPRDLSRVWLLSGDGEYYELPYRSRHRPPISKWEHDAVLRQARKEGVRLVDEALIFDRVERMRNIVDQAAVATKQARRQVERRKASADSVNSNKVQPTTPPAEQSNPAPTARRVPKPFDVEEW
jgi:putative transposase